MGLLKWMARRHYRKYDGILISYIVYKPEKEGKNVFTHDLHPDIEQDEVLKDLLGAAADRIRMFYKERPDLLEEVGIEDKGGNVNE